MCVLLINSFVELISEIRHRAYTERISNVLRLIDRRNKAGNVMKQSECHEIHSRSQRIYWKSSLLRSQVYYGREEVAPKRLRKEMPSLRSVEPSLRDSCYEVSGGKKKRE